MQQVGPPIQRSNGPSVGFRFDVTPQPDIDQRLRELFRIMRAAMYSCFVMALVGLITTGVAAYKLWLVSACP